MTIDRRLQEIVLRLIQTLNQDGISADHFVNGNGRKAIEEAIREAAKK